MSIDNATPEEWNAMFKRYCKDIDERVAPDFPDNVRPDMVNSPSHYNQGGIECIEYIKQVLGDSFEAYCQGNVTKYLHRWRYKNGLEDLRKAQWYLNKMVEHVEEIGE